MKKRLFVLSAVLSLLIACETDSYDKGEGQYSLLQADFGELTVNGQKQGVSFLTDEGDSYTFSQPMTASWIQTPDSVYRATIYYNKVETGTVQVQTLVNMPTVRPHAPSEFKRQPQDPVGLESCWVSRSGKYLNLGLLMKNGRNDAGNEGIHSIAVVNDSVHLNDDNTQTAYYRLLHDQGDAPQYYTNRRYISIVLPMASRPDSVRLTVNTYDGSVEKRMKLN